MDTIYYPTVEPSRAHLLQQEVADLQAENARLAKENASLREELEALGNAFAVEGGARSALAQP